MSATQALRICMSVTQDFVQPPICNGYMGLALWFTMQVYMRVICPPLSFLSKLLCRGQWHRTWSGSQ